MDLASISGRLIAVTDALNRTTTIEYDPRGSGRAVRQTFPDGQSIEFQYDANGNLSGVTPPQKPSHLFEFNLLNFLSKYDPPPAPNTANNFTTYEYNLDKQVTRITRPDGLEMRYQYAPQIGWLTNVSLPFNEQISYQYNSPSCGCSGVGRPSDVIFNAVDYTSSIHYNYDGDLVTGATWSGAVAGTVHASYDNFFRVSSLSVNGSNPMHFGYDDDGLVTQVDDLTLSRDRQNGRLAGTTLGAVSDSWTYTGFGEVQSYTAYVGNTLTFFEYFMQDNAGRITNKVEIIGGMTNDLAYTYHPARGWLTDFSSNGIPTAHYEYDDNGNRTYLVSLACEVTSSYDDQDRLLESIINSAPATYTYSANGELQTRTVGGATRTYAYDVRGNLRSVTLPDNTRIDYIVDATARRIGKKVNGVLVRGWLYYGTLKPIAELDGSGNVVSRFVYGTRLNVPDFMIQSGVTYRIITDHLGSPRLVVNVADGQVVQRIDYDEFGQVLLDTNPGFQPFGFGGGLYDPASGLVHFGARDYDAETGRWTTKDPIRFFGGMNLYGYVVNDPVNWSDPFGLSQADVARILKTFEGSVARMTANGERTDSGWLNNVWVWGNPSKRKGCARQSDTLLGDLVLSKMNGPYPDIPKWRSAYEDEWTFTQESQIVPPHKWVEARSSNPTDPVIKLDPFFNSSSANYGSKDGAIPTTGSNVNSYPATVTAHIPPGSFFNPR